MNSALMCGPAVPLRLKFTVSSFDKFAATSEDFQDVNIYFRNKEQLEILDDRHDKLKKEARKSAVGAQRVEEWRDENSDVLEARLIGALKGSEKRISKLRQSIKLLQNRPTTDRNKERIEFLKGRILTNQINFNTKYNKTMLDRGFIRSLIGNN